MSAIPPNWMASVIQSQGAQDRADEARRKESAEASERVRGGEFAENLQNVINESDEDTQTYADAEGSGSRGKSQIEAEDAGGDEAQDESQGAADGALDIQA